MQRTPLDCAYELGGKNTEILRALQKASGLSPDAEPIKLLSVPKGALAHSFVQRLKLQDNTNGRKQKLAQSISRIQKMKRASSGHSPSRSPNLNQMNSDRRRLRRGETVDVSSPAESLSSGPRLKERPLCRWHTLDSAENPASEQEDEAKSSPKNIRKLSQDSVSTNEDISQAQPSEMPSTQSADSPSSQATESPTSHDFSLNGTSDSSSAHLQTLNGEESTDSGPDNTEEPCPPRPTELKIPNLSHEETAPETPPEVCANISEATD